MCSIKTPSSRLCVSPPGFPSSPVMLAEQATKSDTAGGQDTQTIEESNEFFMHTFKIAPCAKTTLHEWNTCCYAHAGEKAARRDPKLFGYNSVACPEMLQSGKCPRGDFCDMAHSVFEYWLHPQRYRTTLCRDGAACHRSVCFFAHGVEQLRPLTAPLDAAASDSPCSTKGKFGLSGLPAAAQRRRSQEKQARQQNCASASSCSRGGPARQGSGGITMQQRIALVGSNCGRSSSGSLDSVTIPLGHASLASISSNGCVASPVMPLPVLLPRASCMAAAAGGASGVGHLNDLLAAFQAQVISSHQRAAIAQAAVDEVSNQLQGFYTTLGGMPAACDTSVCMPDSSARYAGTACSSPNVYVGGQMQLQGSPVALSNSLSLPQSYAYSPTTAGSRGMQQQQALVSCSSMGPASSFAYNSADGSLLLQLSPAVSGSLAQPVLVAALSADAAFMNMPVAGVPAVATPQVGAGASGCYMQQLAGQSAGLAW